MTFAFEVVYIKNIYGNTNIRIKPGNYFSFKRIEKSIASFFLDNPLARAGDEGGVLSPLTNFWTDNFSWDYGRSHFTIYHDLR